MIPYSDALALIEAHIPVLTPEQRGYAQALGAVTAAPVHSPAAVPPFANSSMDGFAVRSPETVGASLEAPCRLSVVGHTAAGPVAPQAAPSGPCAWEIMTGAPVPTGFDAVVPVEQIDILQRDATGRPGLVALQAPAVADQNIRHAGADFQPGDTIAAAGVRLVAEHVMAIAATGVTSVSVRPAPRVAVIATGAELVDDPMLPLGPGQIRDSNNPYLQAMLPALGAELVYAATLGDDPAAFAAALAHARALAPDLILTSGAVSAGVHDFIPAALREAGAEVHFHKSQVRPGKPILFATLGRTIVFGLPGNPLSVAVGLRFFVTPALRRAQGLSPESWPLARLTNDWRKPAQLTFFGKGVVWVDAQGCLHAAMLPGQESYRIAPLAQANAWLVLPAGAAEVAAGSLISVAPMLPGSWRL